MRRRLDLAMAVVHRPSIPFLDEPTTGLDPVSRTRVRGEVEGRWVFVLLAWGLVLGARWLPHVLRLRRLPLRDRPHDRQRRRRQRQLHPFLPVLFLTALVPESFLSGWLSAVAEVNPVTYLLEAMRSPAMEGWDGASILRGVAAIVAAGVVSLSLALAALRSRVARA